MYIQSILIEGGNEKDQKAVIDRTIEKQIVSDEDVLLLQPSEDTYTITIESVKKLQKQLSISPYNSPVKLAIITNIHRATSFAQHALLKMLEEPRENTAVILTTDNKNSVLPTIVSRCRIISLKADIITVKSQSMPKSKAGCFELAETLSKDNDSSLQWIHEHIQSMRQIFKKYSKTDQREEIQNRLNTLKKLQRASFLLRYTNTNRRLLLENLFLELP